MNDFGKVISGIRKRKKMKQIEFAQMTGVPVTVLSKIENGKRIPSQKQVEKIAKAFNIPSQILRLLSLNVNEVPEDKRDFMVSTVNTIRELFVE